MKFELKRAAMFAGKPYKIGIHEPADEDAAAIVKDDTFNMLKDTGKLVVVNELLGTRKAEDIQAAVLGLSAETSRDELFAGIAQLQAVNLAEYTDPEAAKRELITAAFSIGALFAASDSPVDEASEKPIDDLTRAEIIDKAKADHGVDLDVTLNKANLLAALKELISAKAGQ